MAGYIVQSPIRWGDADGNVTTLEPGDSLPADVSKEERDELLAAGSVVPSSTHKKLEDRDAKLKELEEKRVELETEISLLRTEEVEVQAEAADEVEAAKAPSESKPAPESKAAVSSRQPQQKADTAGKSAPEKK